jgi:hypothetical protein
VVEADGYQMREGAWGHYTEMGVFCQGFYEHVYRFGRWREVGGRPSAFSFPFPRPLVIENCTLNLLPFDIRHFRFSRRWPIIQAALAARDSQPQRATGNVVL